MPLKNIFKLFWLFPLIALSQNQKEKLEAIDHLFLKAEKAYERFEDTKCLEYATKASDMALEINEHNRLAKGYFLMARVLATLEMQKESMLYAKKAEKLGYGKNNNILLAELVEIKAYNYNALGLNILSMQERKETLNLLKDNTTIRSLKIQARAYGDIGSYFYEIGKIDSSLAYLKKKEEVLKRIPETSAILEIAEYYDAKGYILLELDKKEEALHYFNKGYAFKKKHKDPLVYVQYCAFADYYFQNGEKDKALGFYLKALENMKEFDVKHTGYFDIYKKISEIYGEKKQPEKESFYLKQYTAISDSINISRNKKVDYITNNLLKEKGHKENGNNNLTAIIVLVSIIGSMLFLFQYRKSIKIKAEKGKLPISEEDTNSVRPITPILLEDLLELARTNRPNFYIRFQQLYPEFQKRLLEINPNLQAAELKLSAYIYLDFQTKEIAEFTFKSFRTIQNQKNKLRKKLGLSSSENLSLWFKNLIVP